MSSIEARREERPGLTPEEREELLATAKKLFEVLNKGAYEVTAIPIIKHEGNTPEIVRLIELYRLDVGPIEVTYKLSFSGVPLLEEEPEDEPQTKTLRYPRQVRFDTVGRARWWPMVLTAKAECRSNKDDGLNFNLIGGCEYRLGPHQNHFWLPMYLEPVEQS